MTLYHFTSTRHLDSIMTRGLSRGRIPVNATKHITGYIWLTTNSNWQQSWERPDLPLGMSRCDVRIAVDISDCDVRLHRWLDMRHVSRVAPMLHRGCDEENWFVYHGIIRPRQFDAIEYHPRLTPANA